MGVLLSWQNLADAVASSISTSSEANGLGLRGLLTPQISDVWRSGAWGATTINLDVDLGSAQGINVVAVGAPRDGLLPGSSATVSLGLSAQAPVDYSNIHPSPNTITVGANYLIGTNTTDISSATDPIAGSGARRFGSTAGTGVSVLVRTNYATGVGFSTTYVFSCWLRSNATAPNRGNLLSVLEYSAPSFGGTLTNNTGTALVGSGIDGTWRQFTRTFTTRADTQSFQIRWAELWQSGAEIEIWGCSVVRRPEILDTGSLPFSLGTWGVWGRVETTTRTARYLRLAFTGGASDSYLQLGRLWVGPALITTRNAGYGSLRGVQDPGDADRASIAGIRYARPGMPYRVQSWAMPTLTVAEGAQVETMAAAVGATRQVFAARLHTDPGNGIFGAFVQPPSVQRTAVNVVASAVSIAEDL